MSVGKALPKTGDRFSRPASGVIRRLFSRKELARENEQLRKRNEQLERRIARLEEEIADLERKIADLERQLSARKKDSTNSSKPPSSDGPAKAKRIHPQRKKRRRKPGGQKGHPGAHRALIPVEQVTRIVPLLPAVCGHCGRRLPQKVKHLQTQGEVHRHQVTELPEIRPEVTEYQCPSVVCSDCGRTTRALVPQELRDHFGPRLTAFVAYLTAVCRVPRRGVEELLGTALGITISLGTTQKLVEQTSAALEAPYVEIEQQLRHEPVLNIDETGWSDDGEKRWLWAFVAPLFVLFVVAKHRSSEVLRRILGPEFQGILGTDRFSAYIKYHKGKAQFCWAHLKRDLLGILQFARTTDADRFARDALALYARLFRLWHRFRGGEMDRSVLFRKSIPLQQRFFALAERYLDSRDAEVRALATAFFLHCERLFIFVEHSNVDPTNNVAERALRPAVQWRKICFGNRSSEGETATARLLTATRTCAMQKRNVLAFLTDAVRSYRLRLPAPSLLPQQT